MCSVEPHIPTLFLLCLSKRSRRSILFDCQEIATWLQTRTLQFWILGPLNSSRGWAMLTPLTRKQDHISWVRWSLFLVERLWLRGQTKVLQVLLKLEQLPGLSFFLTATSSRITTLHASLHLNGSYCQCRCHCRAIVLRLRLVLTLPHISCRLFPHLWNQRTSYLEFLYFIYFSFDLWGSESGFLISILVVATGTVVGYTGHLRSLWFPLSVLPLVHPMNGPFPLKSFDCLKTLIFLSNYYHVMSWLAWHDATERSLIKNSK